MDRGNLTADDSRLHIEGAGEAVILFAAATDYNLAKLVGAVGGGLPPQHQNSEQEGTEITKCDQVPLFPLFPPANLLVVLVAADGRAVKNQAEGDL